MGWGNEITTLKAVPAEVGDGWRIFIQWASGRMQYISGFESLDDTGSKTKPRVGYARWRTNCDGRAQGWSMASYVVGSQSW